MAIYPASPSAASAQPQPDYAQNQIIVKFRRPVTDTLEMSLSEATSASELKMSHSLDRLNKKYRLRKAKPLFKNFRKNRHHRNALLKKDKALLTKKEKHIIRRLKRAPKGAKVPELDRIYKIDLDLEPGQSIEEVVAAYNNDPDIEYAELNYIVSTNLTPNDPLYPIQWPLNNTGQMYPWSGWYNRPPGTPDADIDAPQAWDIYTGSSEIVVAVIDSGVDYTHRDIDDNMWLNPGEIPGNGIDDDGNGYVDDIYGYDFRNDDSDPKDDGGHGTHCAGIIAAEGNNNLDITGVCWNAKIMALKFLSSSGSGSTTDAVEAFYYAVENGADVTSSSWGGGNYTVTMAEAIDYAHSKGVVMVASAGNDNSTDPYYPAYFDHMFSVAATDSRDRKASFSNYGDWVEIAAPGVDILSLRADGTSRGKPYDNYTTILSGASMACPHVAGTCALLLSIFPETQVDELEQFLTETADPITPGICASGRLNAGRAVMSLLRPLGRICLDLDLYSCSSIVEILLFDSDLKSNASQQINITTEEGDFETVLLTRQSSVLGIFEGTISIDNGLPITEDGTLQVSYGQIITAAYEDANDGTGNPATVQHSAAVDCEPPVVFNVQVDTTEPEPTVTFETDEPAIARVLYGQACGGPYTIDGNNSSLVTSHTIKLIGLSPQTEYFFIIEVTDIVGKISEDDNAGFCYTFTTTGPGDIYVPDEYPTIQEAIDNSWDGGTVWVADGTYTGQGNRDIDFKGKAITVISENGPENCIIDCQATDDEKHRAFYLHNAEDSNSVLDGFTIKNGYTSYGGGIFCDKSSPVISNCVITDNIASNGAAIYCQDSNATITNCKITKNWAAEGGGICCYDSSPVITNCEISENLVAYSGGGICCYDSSPIISNCNITKNTVSHYHYGEGGGICCFGSAPATITNCTVTANKTEREPDSHGGGGGIWCEGPVTIINCTICDNIDPDYGGIVCRRNSAVVNCIIRNNSARQIRDAVSIAYSNIQGGCPGQGNIDNDPCFAFAGDYHIMSGSPCINAGDPNYTPEPDETDLDANPRIIGGRIDMGAYEFNPNSPSIALSSTGFYYVKTDSNPQPQKLLIRNCGGGTLNWEIIEDCQWLQAEPTNGISSGNIEEVILTVALSDSEAGLYSYTFQVSDTSAANSPRNVKVDLLAFGEVAHVPSRFATIQEAIDHVLEEGMVIVADGIYTGDGNRDLDFKNKSITVKSQNGPKNTIIDCEGTQADPHRGLNFKNNENTNAVFNGFTIINGCTDQGSGINCRDNQNSTLTISDCNITNNTAFAGLSGSGGGISVTDGICFINNCTITANKAIDGDGAGGISCTDSIVAINNCVISDNSTEYDGGGISCDHSSLTINNCTISSNSAGQIGGGICCNENSNPIITDCNFTGNTAEWFGGGMCNDENSNPAINNCNFSANSAGYAGGGICNKENSSPTVTNCTFSDNTAAMGGGMANGVLNGNGMNNPAVVSCTFSSNSAITWSGGAIQNYMSSPAFANCIISGNSAKFGGGMSNNENSNPTITNCSFIGNLASEGPAGGMSNSNGSSTTLNNCILWNNRALFWPQIHNSASSSVTVSYSDVQGGWPGEGNINSEPSFVQPGFWDDNGTTYPRDDFWVDGDYHLLPYSPCIDTGDPCYVPEPNETDPDGRPRILFGRIDMGVYEFNHIPVADAGPNQIAYAWLDGIAEVTLDGTGSYDDDGQPLNYFWFWTIDGNDYDASGPTPTIELPVGEHIIELIVNDQIDDSDPDQVTITVLPPIEVPMKFTPQTLNLRSKGNWLKAHFVLPEDFTVDEVDTDTPALIEPLGIESNYMIVFINEDGFIEIEAAFNRVDFCGSIASYDRNIEVMVIGRFTNGRNFYGTDIIKITNRAFDHLAILVSHWLETDCRQPLWCGGADLNRDSVVNFTDFALLNRCCIEVTPE